MAKKLNQVFLNPTAEQIKEYELIAGLTWFTTMDALAAAIEEDQKKKASERNYSLKDFQIVDGERKITANLSKIAKQTGFSLTNDLSKVIEWASKTEKPKTIVDYDVDEVIDHRIASTKADGTATLSDYQREAATLEINRDSYSATADGEKAYKKAVEDQKATYDAGVAVDTKVVGYKDVTLTNIGSKATAVEEGETFADKKTVVTQYSTMDVKGGDFSFDYQLDSASTRDKKDVNLVTESGKENSKISAAAAGTLNVKDSVIGSVLPSFSESANDIRALHNNKNVDALVNNLNNNAGAFETVTIDNSTVNGNIQGGKYTEENSRTFKEQTFLDKEQVVGYYNESKADNPATPYASNAQLYIGADSKSTLKEDEVKELEKKGYTVALDGDGKKDNIWVNKYEIVSYDSVTQKWIHSGEFVYLTTAEYENLSGANQMTLGANMPSSESKNKLYVGYVDYDPDRKVTDLNFKSDKFKTAPTGAAATPLYAVNKYVFENSTTTAKVTYYLTPDELANGIAADILNDGYDTQVAAECVLDRTFRRDVESVTVGDYKWKAAAATDIKVNKYVYENSGTKAKVTYYLTASELADGIATAITAAGYDTQVAAECVTDGRFRRVAASVTVADYAEKAKEAYNTVSTTYSNYTVTKSMSADEALELNKEEISKNGYAWVMTNATSADKALFRMSKFTKSGNDSVENRYYLTAEEMNAMGFFGDGVTKTFNDIKNLAYTDLKLEGWAFTDNAAAGNGRVFTKDSKQMYREGVAATAETLANFTTDKTAVYTADIPFTYKRYELSYTTDNTGATTPLLKGLVTDIDQLKALTDNNLIGANGEYVTVIDGQAVNMYQIYGYGAIVTDPANTVTGEKYSTNDSVVSYDAVIQEALWEGDGKVTSGKATLVDGVKTQNTKKYFDQYASVAGEYVEATQAEAAAGEKEHKFIPVAEMRYRSSNEYGYGNNYVLTNVQAKVQDGDKFVDAYIGRGNKLVTSDKDATPNVTIKYYKKTPAEGPVVYYALTAAEATAAAGASLLDDTTDFKFFVAGSVNQSGWYTDIDAAAAAMTGGDKTKVTDVTPPQYRDYNFTIDDPSTDISAAAYTTLRKAGNLTDKQYWTYDKAYVTEYYGNDEYPSNDWFNYDRVQIDGQDAFIETTSGTLVTSATTSYDAIYEWQLKFTADGASVDGLTYYMTEAEKEKVNKGDGCSTFVFVQVGTEPTKDTNLKYQYRFSNEAAQNKEVYLTYDQNYTKKATKDEGAKWVADNSKAYYDINYVYGEQVYKYTLEGDTVTYYLTDNEAAWIGGAWGGALTKGDKVDGVVHYDYAADYSKKADFTKTDTVYYFSDSYSGYCITKDGDGKAAQAFNADGAVWSNVDAAMWLVDSKPVRLSNTASELCEKTYNYNYDEKEQFAEAQLEQLIAAETKAGIATWEQEEIKGQMVYTRKSSLGEESTYVLNHESVALESNEKGNSTSEATGTIQVINGSEVRGTIQGYLDVTVTDSSVQNVAGGKQVKTSTSKLSTSNAKVAKDGSTTITTKENSKTETTDTGTGTFTVEYTKNDKIYNGAGNVSGYETVTVTGVNTGDLKVLNKKFTETLDTQKTYQGDADALRNDYIQKWKDLAFTDGVVSKVNSDTQKTTTVNTSAGTATVTGREYKFVPGETTQTANKVGDIEGYKTVDLDNVNAGNIKATDSKEDKQQTYKLATKGNVDTATITEKKVTDVKALAELTADNTVTNPALEADLTIGNIEGFKTVTVNNYSFGTADASGELTTTKSTSSVREEIASDMRLVNAGYANNYAPVKAQQYKYGAGGVPTTAAVPGAGGTYANNDMSYSADVSTKRTAVGTLTATGHAYTAVTANYVEDEAKNLKPVYAYTQNDTKRTVYLTEDEFKSISSNSKADAKKWTKDEKKVVYYRNAADSIVEDFTAANVKGVQVVYLCENAGKDKSWYLTEGELANYNLVNSGDQLTKSGDASLRKDNAAKVIFSSNVNNVNTASGKVGTIDKVYLYTKAGEADQYLTEAEATEGWTKDASVEYVRLANAGDDRSDNSVMAKTAMTADLKVYQNNYDSSMIIVLTADEEQFIKDTSDALDDYTLSSTKGYRKNEVNAAGLGVNMGTVPPYVPVSTTAGWSTTIVEAHSYVKLDKDGELIPGMQAYVTDEEYNTLKATGKAMDGWVLDDGSHNVPTTQFQYREAGFKVDADTTLLQIIANRTEVQKDELYGWALDDTKVEALNLYAPNKKSKYVLDVVTEDPTKANTSFGNIYGYKDVILSDMQGGNILRVQDKGLIAADNETNKTTYKKTIAKGSGKNKGKTTYTETDSNKVSRTWTAAGSVTLTDSKVGNIAGYKNVEVTAEDGTVEVGTISRTTTTLGTSWDKETNDVSNKVVTEDAVSSFTVTATNQTKQNRTATAAGSVSLIGKRKGEDLVLDDSVVYKTTPEATKAAQDAIDAHDNKQFADVILKGGVVGYQDVIVENATFTAGAAFDGGKQTETISNNQTTVEITDNNGDTVKVMNKINDSKNTTFTAAGTLTLTNVNYADPNGYTANFKSIANQDKDYTKVNEYLFNGATYALTVDEKNALLEYGVAKKNAKSEKIENVLRKNDSITTPAVELKEGSTLADIKNVKGVDVTTTIYKQNQVYFAATAKSGAGATVNLYIKADKVEDLLDGKIADIDDPTKVYTEAKVTVETKFYGKDATIDCYKKDVFEGADGDQVKANVKKYEVEFAEGKKGTYYLTEAEKAVMEADGMTIKADSDTTAYTRMTSVGQVVTVNDIKTLAATKTENVYEYRGVVKDSGKSVSYYLTEDEFNTIIAKETPFSFKDALANFGKVGTQKYYRSGTDDLKTATTLAELDAKATVGCLCYEVSKYTKAGDDIYLTAKEFENLEAIDANYKGYAKADDNKYYRTAKSAYTITKDSDTLDAKFTSVNESAKVFEVVNKNNSKVLGYLTDAEILALGDDFAKYYKKEDINNITYLRAAADTTDIVKINPFKEGDGYVIKGNLPAALYNAVVSEAAAPAKANAKGFQTVNLTNADMGNLEGGKSTYKDSQKLAAKKNSTIATYTTTLDKTDTATGSLTANNSAIGNASWYEKVELTADEMDKVNNKAGDIKGGKKTSNQKVVYTSKLWENKLDYSNKGKVLEYTETTKSNYTASGSATLENMVAGNISGYKDVAVSFINDIDNDDKTKNQVGGIKGGNIVSNATETSAYANTGSYSETTSKDTITSIGKVELFDVVTTANVEYFERAVVVDSEITGDLTSGKWVVNTTEVDVNKGVAASTAVEKTVTATGKATLDASTIGGNIAQFKDVKLVGDVEVTGDIIVGGINDEKATRGAIENIACYAVFYTDSTTGKQVVYLTEDEYEVFATQELTAMIDTTVAVYRPNIPIYAALTEAELKDADTAVATMKTFTVYTDDAITDGVFNPLFVGGAGKEGKNTTVWDVKTWGNSLTIGVDEEEVSGAAVSSLKVGGRVQGYMSVTVAGASSFKDGYFGTAKSDKLTVENSSLATFTPLKSGNGFDFGEGKDELILNKGTIGIQAAFKYDAVEGTNAWNLEKVSGTGTIVCRTADVNDVKEAFEGDFNVVGSDNYSAATALTFKDIDNANKVGAATKIDEWLGFCDDADYYENTSLGEMTFSFSGAGVSSGDVIAQVTVNGGISFDTLKDGEKVAAGAVVRISQSSASKNKASNDYQISFKA